MVKLCRRFCTHHPLDEPLLSLLLPEEALPSLLLPRDALRRRRLRLRSFPLPLLLRSFFFRLSRLLCLSLSLPRCLDLDDRFFFLSFLERFSFFSACC